ncbi:hypothetical protein GGS20DRAFT_249936 [Poronia punctata]|nr:hypothetical protein GGS20DRAFT_249936 [Poronia punctata]
MRTTSSTVDGEYYSPTTTNIKSTTTAATYTTYIPITTKTTTSDQEWSSWTPRTSTSTSTRNPNNTTTIIPIYTRTTLVTIIISKTMTTTLTSSITIALITDTTTTTTTTTTSSSVLVTGTMNPPPPLLSPGQIAAIVISVMTGLLALIALLLYLLLKRKEWFSKLEDWRLEKTEDRYKVKKGEETKETSPKERGAGSGVPENRSVVVEQEAERDIVKGEGGRARDQRHSARVEDVGVLGRVRGLGGGVSVGGRSVRMPERTAYEDRKRAESVQGVKEKEKAKEVEDQRLRGGNQRAKTGDSSQMGRTRGNGRRR